MSNKKAELEHMIEILKDQIRDLDFHIEELSHENEILRDALDDIQSKAMEALSTW